ncbi:MAG: acyl-CoA dehydrogenase [Chloroflexi bacterium 13_1_40CM_4_68_4]|nr:MAG: acyl-CoA dehydrogenase [Chloroflexi bacterium 13_1_40CM_4_68_4]
MATTMTKRIDAAAVARELGPRLAARAAQHDADDSFVADSYQNFKEAKLFSAGVPAELGGGGATHAELCEMLNELGRHCGSSALSLSMHTHLLAATVWRYRNNLPLAEGLLKRIAAEELVLVSSGGSDWLDGSGTLEKSDGTYEFKARKVFGSGSPSGDVLVTTGVYDDPTNGPTVMHFGVSLRDPKVKILDNWRTLGMRATGSNDIVIDGVIVKDESITLRRPKGKWAPFFDVVTAVAWPLVSAAYLGVAEAARPTALAFAAKKRDDTVMQALVGEMDTHLAAARLAWREMIRLANNYDFKPSLQMSKELYEYKTLFSRSAIGAVDKAMEIASGPGFFRSAGLERLFRDVQGTRYHPWNEKRQAVFSGRIALGLDPV